MRLVPHRSPLLATPVLVSTLLVGQSPTKQSIDINQLIGLWEGTDDNGTTGSIQFKPGGYAQITINGIDMVPMIPNGPYLKFVITQSKFPIWLDFITFNSSHKEIRRMKCIIEQLSTKEIKIKIGANFSNRPKNFDGSNATNAMVLKKVDEMPNLSFNTDPTDTI